MNSDSPVTAVYFIKTTPADRGPADNGAPGEDIVHERSGLRAVKQAGARLSF